MSKSKTPIHNFINDMNEADMVRLHMPGHKGAFGYDRDITEITGADSLYEASGIILESEEKTSAIFGTRHTYYGTEGSSQMVKAICYLALMYGKKNSQNTVIAASRNAHKSFIHASMLLRFDIAWIASESAEYSLTRCEITPAGLDCFLVDYKKQNSGHIPSAVYVTSPDYLGNMLDIHGLAEVAHKHGTLLIVDNAHGAYLRFMDNMKADSAFLDAGASDKGSVYMPESDIVAHPISLGADMCVDSAHKTLPVLTGGAYLHISKTSPEGLGMDARQALSMFGSTSPSYLILESLDMVSERVDVEKYRRCAAELEKLKNQLKTKGIILIGDEPLKLTIDAGSLGMMGPNLGKQMREEGFECEYIDRDYVVTMWSPYIDYMDAGEKLANVLMSKLDQQKKVCEIKRHMKLSLPEVVYRPYETIFMPRKSVMVGDDIVGSVAADTVVGCPPAVTPVVAGERIDENVIDILRYYDIRYVSVIEK